MTRYVLFPVIALTSLVACTIDPSLLQVPGASKATPSAAAPASGSPTTAPVAAPAVAPVAAPTSAPVVTPAAGNALSASLILDGKPMTFNLELNPQPTYSGSSVMWAIGKFGSNGPENAYVLATVFTSAKSAQAGFATAAVTSLKLSVNPSSTLSVGFIGTPSEACRITVSGDTADIHYKGPFNVFDGKKQTTQAGEFDVTGLKLR